MLTIYILILFSLLLSSLDLNNNYVKNVANNVINNVLTIECLYDDLSLTKGTGVIIANTKIISVSHIFDNTKEIVSIMAKKYNSDTEYDLQLVKQDAVSDLSLLVCSDLNVSVEFANSNNLQYGDEIIKIGNSLGYGLCLDYGIISNPYKKIIISEQERELIQISCQIYSGDSGAPVFDKKSKLIGIVSFKTSSSITSDAELSFAIPSNKILEFL